MGKDPEQPDDTEQPDDLTPQIERRSGPPAEVVAAREALAARSNEAAAALQPNIEAHLLTYRAALDALDGWHRTWIDQTDLDPTGDNRLSAVWQMAGRCIGLARALLYLVEGGYCAEAIPMARTLHEANRLVAVFIEPEGKALLRQWLKGQEVRAGAVRQVIEKAETRYVEAAAEAGVDLTPTVEMSRGIHGNLSEAGHSERRWVEDSVMVEERLMALGPHPSARRRAAYVVWAGTLIEETLMDAGLPLCQLLSGKGYTEHVTPLLETFHAIRATCPLPD